MQARCTYSYKSRGYISTAKAVSSLCSVGGAGVLCDRPVDPLRRAATAVRGRVGTSFPSLDLGATAVCTEQARSGLARI